MKGLLSIGILLGLTPVALAQQGPILIGEVAALTGPAATVGTRLNKVAQMWAEEVNAKGGIKGRKIEIITCNDEGRPDMAATCARDMIEKKVALILGHTLTGSLRAILSLAAKGPVVVLSSPNIEPAAETYAFQVSPGDQHMTRFLAGRLNKEKVTSIGMVAATDASGETAVKNANEIFPREGIKLRLERIDLRAVDATSQLAAVTADSPPLLYVSYTGGGAAVTVKSFNNIGLKQTVLLSYGNVSSAFVQVIKDVMPEKVVAIALKSIDPSALTDPTEKQKTDAFLKAYSAKFNENADMISLNGKLNVDTAYAALSGVSDLGNADAMKALLESKPIESVQTLRFSSQNHIGLGEDALAIVNLKNARWTNAKSVLGD
jgi:branched-chain amino acid transport system substrate-binding protein